MGEHRTDVFICGAGPVGLVLAYQLNRLGVSTYIIDAVDKASPDTPMYGRACSLRSRTLEVLDQLDLFDDLAQEGLLSNRSFTYQNGERVFGRGWSYLDQNTGTYFPYTLNLRLKYSEDILRRKLAEVGGHVNAPLKLVGFALDEDPSEEYRISVQCVDPIGNISRVAAKYIIGADGGSSTVRRLAQIPFPGGHKDQHWVRIDAVVESDVPQARIGQGTFESTTHGHVLWVALDHGRTRIGYVLSKELFEKYGNRMTQEEAVHEARLACQPFHLDFRAVDWHTVYGVQQHVVDRLVDRGRIVLAGDAAHTHSSGQAHGMNAGVQDAASLGWRLAGTIKGWYRPGVLENYSDERGAVAQTLISSDKVVSMLMSGERPEALRHRHEDNVVLLDEFVRTTQAFSSGLGVQYPPNLLNFDDQAFAAVKIRPGARCADVLLHKPGFRQRTIRLHELAKNDGKFKVLVFTARAEATRPDLRCLRAQVDLHQARHAHAVNYFTIIEGSGQALDEHLGLRKFGWGYWDIDSNAHWTFGLGDDLGGIVVVRPDGIIGATAPLKGFAETVLPYFGRIVVEASVQKSVSRSSSHREPTGASKNPPSL